MRQEQFEQIIENQIEMIREVLIIKGREYATEDKLHNFRTAAILRNCTLEQALAGMLSKHTVSIYDMINKSDSTRFGIDQWNEKINDHIIYLLLLRAIIEDDDMGYKATEEPKTPESIEVELNNLDISVKELINNGIIPHNFKIVENSDSNDVLITETWTVIDESVYPQTITIHHISYADVNFNKQARLELFRCASVSPLYVTYISIPKHLYALYLSNIDKV